MDVGAVEGFVEVGVDDGAFAGDGVVGREEVSGGGVFDGGADLARLSLFAPICLAREGNVKLCSDMSAAMFLFVALALTACEQPKSLEIPDPFPGLCGG